MVFVRVSRQVGEVLGDAPSSAAIAALDVQVAADATSASTGAARVSRHVVEVLGTTRQAAVAALDVQVGSSILEASTYEIQLSRYVAEVLGSAEATPAIAALDVQVAADPISASATAAVRVSRYVAEALSTDFGVGTVYPLPLADNLEFFLHNWATRAELSTEWRTSISEAPATGEEARRGLVSKPYRTMTFEWLEGGNSLARRTDLEAVERMLATMSRERFQMPLYMDQFQLTQAHASGLSTIQTPGRLGRYFIGARVLIVTPTYDMRVQSYIVRTIQQKESYSLTFTETLGVDIPAGALIFPLMDCEMILEVAADYYNSRITRVQMSVVEVPGRSALLATKYGRPVNVNYFDSIPIFDANPNWVDAVRRYRRRGGNTTTQGRGTQVTPKGTRSRQGHAYSFLDYREEAWRMIQFFDSRQGALKAFWHVDQDQSMVCSAVDAGGASVSVFELTSQANFEVELDYIGIVLYDGTVIVRQVSSVGSISGQYIVTPTTSFPTGLTVAQIARVARARLSRFETDAMVEQWASDNVLPLQFSVLEVLGEH